MEKHLLVTVSEQKSALFGIKFVGDFFSKKKDMKLTLYFTYPKGISGWTDEDYKRQHAKHQKQNEANGQQALEEAKKVCCAMGFDENQISLKLEMRKTNRVLDILHEGAKGRYDAVVLGRRGVSWLEEAFDESVTKGLLKEKFHFPVWLCKNPAPDRQNILICVDGSDAAYRMADHVGFILEKEPRHQIVLFAADEDRKKAEDIIATARGHLVKNGFDEKLVKTVIVSEANAAKAIIAESNKGKFAAVTVGRRHAAPGALKNLFFGSVSTRLFNEMEGASLWVCY